MVLVSGTLPYGWAERIAEGLGEGRTWWSRGSAPPDTSTSATCARSWSARPWQRLAGPRGEEVRFIFHADTIDPLRKIAPGIPEEFEEFIGQSISRVPDLRVAPPLLCRSLPDSFEEALGEMEMDIEVLRSHELYENGVYTEVTRRRWKTPASCVEILQEVSGRKMPSTGRLICRGRPRRAS